MKTFLIIGKSKISGLQASVSIETDARSLRDILDHAEALHPWLRATIAKES